MTEEEETNGFSEGSNDKLLTGMLQFDMIHPLNNQFLDDFHCEHIVE